MKLLVATHETQGWRPNDFCFTDDGELVYRGFECDGEPVDGPCGCHRSMAGANSQGGTTTFKVVERADITPAQLRELLRQALVAAGWDVLGSATLHRMAAEYAAEIGQVAARFPAGTVLERRGNRYWARPTRAVVELRAERERRRRPRRKRRRRES